MKKNLLFGLLSLAVAGASAQTRLPEAQLHTLQGQTINAQSLLSDGVPVVISFWSTICKPCIEELNAFRDQWTKWQKEVNFKIVAVSVDDARSVGRVRTFASSRKWPFTVLLDKNQDFKRALNVNTIPQLYIIEADGKIVYSHIGYTPGSETKVLEVLKSL